MPTTPVLVTAFNRPDLLRDRLQELRQLHEGPLFVAIDGPRAERQEDVDAVRQCVEVANQEVRHRPVEIRTRPENLGCKDAMIDAISWFMGEAGEGVIIEDDVRIGGSFLPFCSRMLDLHREDEAVAMIGGFVPDQWRGEQPYLFSRITTPWGWGTWADRWDWMRSGLDDFRRAPSTVRLWRRSGSLRVANSARNQAAWAARGVNSWYFWWNTCVVMRGSLTVLPRAPLAQNLGGDRRATHTQGMESTADPIDIEIPAARREPTVDDRVDAWVLNAREGSGFDLRAAIPPELLRLLMWGKSVLRQGRGVRFGA